MNMWLWSGAVVFCAAVVGTQVYLARRGSHGVAARLGAYVDRVALVAGVVVLLVVQFLARSSGSDAVLVWVCGLWWGLAATQLVHLIRVKRGAVGTPVQ